MTQANYGNDGLRPIETIESQEWAKLEKARRTTDPKKLAAMLPPWLKQALNKPPKRFEFVPNQPPVYPSWTYGRAMIAVPPTIPDTPNGGWQSVADYVAAFEKANGLRKVEIH